MTYTPYYSLLGLAFLSCYMGLKWFFCGLRCRSRTVELVALLSAYFETLTQLQAMADQIEEPSAFLVRQRIQTLIDKGAVHRKGYRIVEVPLEQILVRAGEELQELKDEPDDIEELADTMLCLMHYQIRKGWSQRELVAAMLHKLSIRFTIPEESDDRT